MWQIFSPAKATGGSLSIWHPQEGMQASQIKPFTGTKGKNRMWHVCFLALFLFPLETDPIQVQLRRRLPVAVPAPPALFCSALGHSPCLGTTGPLAWGAVKDGWAVLTHLCQQSGRPEQPQAKSTWNRGLVLAMPPAQQAAPCSCSQDWSMRTVTYFLAAPNLSNLLAQIP